MKQETNNEIDLLLRRLARRPDVELRPDQNHLDADELSSYAENALPSAARARYTEHIADCSRCRELVVQLSSSVELVNAAEEAKVPALSGVRKFLASLFSPMVLRYAVPALGVVLVMVIGFLVVRRDRMADSVAQLSEPEQKTVALPKAQETPAGFVGELADKTQSSPTPSAVGRIDNNKSPQDQPVPPPPNAPPAVTVTTEVKPAAPASKPEQQPVANEPPPAAKVAATDEESKTVSVQAKKETIDNRTVAELPARNTVELAKGAGTQSAERGAAQPGSAKSKTDTFGAVSARRARQPVQRDGTDKDEDTAESRSVAGRNFRKQRGVWIDTAYEASKSLTTVSRDSEQFRALVADEPAIKTIANQLDGEIIVVWKGRAYRIR